MKNLTWKGFVRALTLLTGLSLIAGAAGAGVIQMKNGDRITGTISEIYDSEVTIEPEYADKITVAVSAIDYLP